MAEENTDIPLSVEVSGGESSRQDESFDIPVAAIAEISKPEDAIEESTDIPLALEVNGNEGSQNESFDISATMEVKEPQIRNVQVIVDIINSQKIRPRVFSRYLSPRADSCHDFCKYGMNHSLEGKPSSSILKKRNSVGSDGRDLRRIIVSLAKRNKDPTSSKPINITDLKEDVISSPKIVTSSPTRLLSSIKEGQASAVHYGHTKLNLSLSKQNEDAISSKSSWDYNAMSITDLKEDVISSTQIVTPPKRLLPTIKEVQAAAVHYSRVKPNLSLSNASSFVGKASSRTKRNKQVRKGKKQDGGGSSSSYTNSTSRCQEEDMKALVPQAVSWIPRNRAKRVAIADNKVRGRHGLKNQIRPIKIKPGPINCDVVEEKTIYMIEPSTENETEESAQINVRTNELPCQESSTATDNNLKHEQEADGTPIVSPWSAKRNMRRARSGTNSTNLSTSPTVSKGVKGVRPKRFSLIQISEARSAPSSPLSSRFSSEPIHGKHGGRTTRTLGQDVKKSEKSKAEHKIKTERMALTDSESIGSQSRKLKFRKGRTVELQTEIITPRRLKFRPVRFIGDIQSPKSDSRNRIIQRKEANQNGDKMKEVENSSLRQQDQEIKKKKSFGKEKTIELQTETITPRRLKFRPARLLGETQSPRSDSRKRISQRKEANQNGDEAKEGDNSSVRQQDHEIKKKKSFRRKETMDGKLVSSRIKSERIVLRHQDSRGKKKIQNLFNNVIEETASKLAQTRKSKVKALVGAFETVISLQDTRPAATVGA